jgi:hypothetical protein
MEGEGRYIVESAATNQTLLTPLYNMMIRPLFEIIRRHIIDWWRRG